VDHFQYGNDNLGASGIGDAIWSGGDSPNFPITVNSNAALNYAGLSAFTNVTWTSNYPATDPVFTPPYSYSLNSAAAVPAMVMEHAGAGRGPVAP
jgi:hypothetical protein